MTIQKQSIFNISAVLFLSAILITSGSFAKRGDKLLIETQGRTYDIAQDYNKQKRNKINIGIDFSQMIPQISAESIEFQNRNGITTLSFHPNITFEQAGTLDNYLGFHSILSDKLIYNGEKIKQIKLNNNTYSGLREFSFLEMSEEKTLNILNSLIPAMKSAGMMPFGYKLDTNGRIVKIFYLYTKKSGNSFIEWEFKSLISKLKQHLDATQTPYASYFKNGDKTLYPEAIYIPNSIKTTLCEECNMKGEGVFYLGTIEKTLKKSLIQQKGLNARTRGIGVPQKTYKVFIKNPFIGRK